jgi:GDPmannose 4,6-dehydratase
LDYRDYVKINPQFLRPADVDTLLGDASKAKKKLGWSHKISFQALVHEMVDEDVRWLKAPE